MTQEPAPPDPVAEWVRISQRDARTARLALDGGDPENALYLCQQALEKALKAHIHQQTGEHPPRIHNLPRLLDVAGLTTSMSAELKALLLDVDAYTVIGRYGALATPPGETPSPEDARHLLAQTEEAVECIIRALK